MKRSFNILSRYPAPKGHVTIFIEKRDGSLRCHWRDPNCVVYGIRRVFAKLLTEANSAFLLDRIHLGIGGHAPGDPTTPVAPTPFDSELDDEAFQIQVMSGEWELLPSDLGATSIKFTVPLEWDEGNGTGTGTVEYTEAGLFTANGVMVARETFPVVVKDADTRVIFNWTLML